MFKTSDFCFQCFYFGDKEGFDQERSESGYEGLLRFNGDRLKLFITFFNNARRCQTLNVNFVILLNEFIIQEILLRGKLEFYALKAIKWVKESTTEHSKNKVLTQPGLFENEIGPGVLQSSTQ